VPNEHLLLGEQDPLKTEQEIWRDRLAVMQRSATSPDGTVSARSRQRLADSKDVIAVVGTKTL